VTIDHVEWNATRGQLLRTARLAAIEWALNSNLNWISIHTPVGSRKVTLSIGRNRSADSRRDSLLEWHELRLRTRAFEANAKTVQAV